MFFFFFRIPAKSQICQKFFFSGNQTSLVLSPPVEIALFRRTTAISTFTASHANIFPGISWFLSAWESREGRHIAAFSCGEKSTFRTRVANLNNFFNCRFLFTISVISCIMVFKDKTWQNVSLLAFDFKTIVDLAQLETVFSWPQYGT